MAVHPPPQPPRDPLNDPAHFLALGLDLANSKAGALARTLAERARESHAEDPFWQALAGVVQRAEIPEFHAKMLNDQPRNAAYRAAIERFAPGRRVLDIGTGSGLLAMMAGLIWWCPRCFRIALSAKGCCNHSPMPAPGTIFLPEQASLMVALAEFPQLIEGVGMVEGFDLSGFSPHLNPRRYVFADDPALIVRSVSSPILTFDFAEGDPASAGTAECELLSTGGNVSGLAQWLHLRFAEDITYENRPGSGPGLHWAINLAPCAARMSEPGDRYAAGSWYSEATQVSWCRHLDTD